MGGRVGRAHCSNVDYYLLGIMCAFDGGHIGLWVGRGYGMAGSGFRAGLGGRGRREGGRWGIGGCVSYMSWWMLYVCVWCVFSVHSARWYTTIKIKALCFSYAFHIQNG